MSISKSSFATALLAGSMCLLGALASPQAKVDYTTLPAPPEQVQQQISQSKVSLAQAIDIAQKEINGVAKSASMRLDAMPPAIDVTAYANGKAHHIVIDAASGAIVSNTPLPRLPGEAFEGEFTELPSGLKLIDLKVGEGPEVADPNAVIQTHLGGYLVDGTQFVNTHQSQPLLVPLDQIFPGFTEGVQGMKAGGKRKLVLPPDLALGDQGSPPTIPANATLIFDVELLWFQWDAVPANLPGEPVQGEPTTTPAGLKYYDVKVGEGKQPESNSTVKVHYTGWLVNGNKFDSSIDRGEPTEFPLNQVIPGWQEGVGSMKIGGKRKLIVPANLAYGDGGQPGIPPGATLIFDVELLDVQAPPAAPVPPQQPSLPVPPPPAPPPPAAPGNDQ